MNRPTPEQIEFSRNYDLRKFLAKCHPMDAAILEKCFPGKIEAKAAESLER